MQLHDKLSEVMQKAFCVFIVGFRSFPRQVESSPAATEK